jgi:rhodanese-related sulfurtransferase
MPGLDDSPEAEARREHWRARRRRRARPPPRAADAGASLAAQAAAEGRAALSEGLSGYWETLAANSWVSSSASSVDEEEADEEGSAAAAEGAGAGAGAGPSSSSGVGGVGGVGVGGGGGGGGSGGTVTPDELAAALRAGSAAVLDVRGAREWEWGKIKGARHAPFVLSKGSSLNPTVEPNPGFLAAAAAAAPNKGRPVIVYGAGSAPAPEEDAVYVSKEMFVSLAPGGAGGEVHWVVGSGRRRWALTGAEEGARAARASPAPLTLRGRMPTPAPLPPPLSQRQDFAAAAAAALREAGYASVAELAGGYRSWDLAYRPDGRRRAKGAFRDKSSGEGPGRAGPGGGWAGFGGGCLCRTALAQQSPAPRRARPVLSPPPKTHPPGELEYWTASN